MSELFQKYFLFKSFHPYDMIFINRSVGCHPFIDDSSIVHERVETDYPTRKVCDLFCSKIRLLTLDLVGQKKTI